MSRDTLRSHVMDNALAMSGRAGRSGVRPKKGVVKNRFRSPFVTYVTIDGKTTRTGNWHAAGKGR